MPDPSMNRYAAPQSLVRINRRRRLLSPRGVRRDAPDGVGHMIQLQRPDIVIDAVREVIGLANA